ncbi:MAG: radical SAM protein [Candidatus Altiarchaeota archaeon]|nr:radical SAM protein [Candidatus Altiarchaeota archaeon]
MEEGEFIDEVVRLGLKCNFKCEFCNVTEKNESHQTTSDIDSVRKRIKNATLRGHKYISLSGGEPTLQPYLPKLIREMKNDGIHVRLQTNASLITPKLASELKDAKLDDAFINFTSHLPENFERLTGTSKHMFKKVVGGIKELITHDIEVVLNIVITDVNKNDLVEYIRFISREFGRIQSVNLSVIQPHGHARVNSHLVPNYQDLIDPISECVSVARKLKIRIENPYCGLPLCITHKILDDVENGELMGVLNARKLKKVSDPLRRIMKSKTRTPSCRDCYTRSLCLGVWKEYYVIRGDVVEPRYRSLRGWSFS